MIFQLALLCEFTMRAHTHEASARHSLQYFQHGGPGEAKLPIPALLVKAKKKTKKKNNVELTEEYKAAIKAASEAKSCKEREETGAGNSGVNSVNARVWLHDRSFFDVHSTAETLQVLSDFACFWAFFYGLVSFAARNSMKVPTFYVSPWT